MKRILFASLILLTTLLFAVPVAADTPPGEKPLASRSPAVFLKGIVTEKGESSFVIKSEQKTIKIGVDTDSRFYKNAPQVKPPATTKAPASTAKAQVTTTRTAVREKDAPVRQSPEATAGATKKPESTTAIASPPTKTAAPRESTLQVTFKDLAVGDAVAVETNGNIEAPLAKAVHITSLQPLEPKPAPTKAVACGAVVTINEVRMAFSIKTASGDMTFTYDKNTVFSLLGSASLKAGMEVEVAYLASSGTPVARAVKAPGALAPEAAVKK